MQLDHRFLTILVTLSITLISSHGLAHESKDYYDRVTISANASMEVDHDELQASLYAVSESEDAKKSVSEVTERIQKALSIIERQQEISVQTGNFNTYPTYHKNKITGWRSRQTIELKSKDAAHLSQLLSHLQNHLQIENIRYVVSDRLKSKSENNLIETAIENFQHRARLVTHSMHREQFRVVEMTVSTDQTGPMMMHNRMMVADTKFKADMPAPAIQPGTQKIQVMVNGTVELQLNSQ